MGRVETSGSVSISLGDGGGLAQKVEQAMVKATGHAHAAGVYNPEKVKEIKLAAREWVKSRILPHG